MGFIKKKEKIGKLIININIKIMVNNFLNTFSTEETNAIKFVLNEMFNFYLNNPSEENEIFSLIESNGYNAKKIISILNENKLIEKGKRVNIPNYGNIEYIAVISDKGIEYLIYS